MNDWGMKQIQSLGRVVTGKTPPTSNPEYFGGDELFVSPKDLDWNSHYITETETRITSKALEKFKNQVVPRNTVMFTSLSFAFGKMGIASKPCLTNQQINSVIVNKENCPKFVYYLLRAYEPIIFSYNSGIDTPIVPKSVFEKIEVKIPSKKLQQKIAAILSAYDELIENNQRRIELLEKMAEEIYREWFVRLRFPGHENAKFSKGLPVDWDTKRVKEIVIRKGFGRIYREDELFDQGKVIVIDQSRADCLGYYDGEPQHIASPNLPIILFGDHSCKMILMTKPFSLAENVIPFTPKPKVSPYFLFHLVKNLARTTEYKRHWTDLTNREVLIPKESLQVEFENVVKHNHEQIEVLQQAIRKAEKVRNMLLPRLIFGKLSVENLDIQFPPGMEEAAHEA
jgi:type I restriction enzyme S subunit